MTRNAATSGLYTMRLIDVPELTPNQLAVLSQLMPVFAFTFILKLWRAGQ